MSDEVLSPEEWRDIGEAEALRAQVAVLTEEREKERAAHADEYGQALTRAVNAETRAAALARESEAMATNEVLSISGTVVTTALNHESTPDLAGFTVLSSDTLYSLPCSLDRLPAVGTQVRIVVLGEVPDE